MSGELTGTTHYLLLKLTHQGGINPEPGAALAQVVGALETLGGTVTSTDVVFGEWDYIVRVEGLDNIDIARIAFRTAQQGDLKTTTLCAEPAAACLSEVETPHPLLNIIQPHGYRV